VGSGSIAYPAMARLGWLPGLGAIPLKFWILILGMIVALAFALFMVVGHGSRLARNVSRIAIAVTLGGTVVVAAFWAFVWQPVLAQHLSSKAMFETYLDLRKPGDTLVM